MTASVAPVVSVEDLRRAYRAALAGEFRHPNHQGPIPADPGSPGWDPGSAEQVVLVVGACGGAGTSTVALGLATCAGEARLVECCTVSASGLAGASTAEMGVVGDGWVQGTRDAVLIERRSDRVLSLAAMPAPAPTDRRLTVVDCPGDVDVLLATSGWLGELARTVSSVVVVSRPSAPGLRRLEAAVGLLGAARVHGVLVGAPRRWPRQLDHHLGPVCRQLRAESRLVLVPHDARLALEGLTPDSLPAPLVAAISPVFEGLRGTLR